MANGHGGARAPDRKPRPPAGPGKLANRQDLSRVTPAGQPGQGAFVPTGLPYGDRQRLLEAQNAVPAPQGSTPTAGAPGPAPEQGGAATGQAASLSLAGLLARPSGRPGEPVTAGLPVGPGPGPEAMFQPSAYDQGVLRRLVIAAQRPDLPPEIRGLSLLFNLVEKAKELVPEVVVEAPIEEGLFENPLEDFPAPPFPGQNEGFPAAEEISPEEQALIAEDASGAFPA